MAYFSLLLDSFLEEAVSLTAAEGHLRDEGRDGLDGGKSTGLLWLWLWMDWGLELILIIIPTITTIVAGE